MTLSAFSTFPGTANFILWDACGYQILFAEPVAHCRNDLDYRLYLTFSIIYDYTQEAYKLKATEALFNSFNDFERRSSFDLGSFLKQEGAKAFAHYVLEGWQENCDFSHCPSVEPCED